MVVLSYSFIAQLGLQKLIRGSRFRDESRGTFEGDIRPEPFDHHRNPVLQVGEEHDVDHTPEPPGEYAFHAEFAEISNGSLPADGGQTAIMLIAEFFLRRSALN